MVNNLWWFRQEMACGTVRYRLCSRTGESETPYFIDVAKTRAHFTEGQRVGLMGSGMGEFISTTDAQGNYTGGYRIAKVLGSFNSLKAAQKQAIEYATGA